MYSFKDLMITPVEQGEDEYIKYRRQKQRKIESTSEQVEYQEVDEALTTSQRLAKSRQMKRYKSKMALGRKRALSRSADRGRLKTRAAKHARMQMFKKLSKGKSPSDVPFQRRAEIEKRLDKMKTRIDRIAVKMLPKVRQMEKDRRSSSK